MNLFFCQNIENDLDFLPETEARHCVQVLRKQIGDAVSLVDVKGGFYEGVIEETGKKKCVVKIQKQTQNFYKRNHFLHIAIAPTKNIDRFEWFLEKATEIGIDEITPLYCEHSERKNIRLDRLEKIVLSAMKQSLKAYLPKLNELTKFSNFMATLEKNNDPKFVAHCQIGEKTHLKNNALKDQNVTILIGPEGDFSPSEIQLANQHDFGSITLGSSRLRTETAGVVACHIVNLLND
jgi:16S rRNA (uracil1498-N3)-methyltransferase